MKIKMPNKTDIGIYIGLFAIAFFVCCTSCLNPFSLRKIDNDTSVYLTIAKGITEGNVPYRDFFDNKGPLLYLISAPGFYLVKLTGVWITELIFLCISVFFSYKIALFFGSKFSAFFGVLCSFLVFNLFFYEAAGSEEYSLPFMIISLYVFTKYYFSEAEPSAVELTITGMCFSIAVLLRLNMFPLWLGFCLVIIIESIIKRRYLLLGKYTLCFLAGILLVVVPVMIYLIKYHAFNDFIKQCIFSGAARGLQGASIKEVLKSFFEIIGKKYSFAPIIVGALWIIKIPRRKAAGFYIGYTLAYFLSVFFLAVIRTSSDHFNMVLTPFFIPAFVFFIEAVCDYWSAVKNHKRLVVILFLCLVFSEGILKIVDDNIFEISNTGRNEIISLGEIIDKNTNNDDEIISLGLNCRIYLFTDRGPASRYIYQTSGVEYYPGAKTEFVAEMLDKKPAVIILDKEDYFNSYFPQWYSPIFVMIENEYGILADTENYFLYKRLF